MKKKLLTTLLAMLIAICLVFSITACDLGTKSGTEQSGNAEQGSDTEQGNDTEQSGNTEQGSDTEQGSNSDNGEVGDLTPTEGLEYTLSNDGTYYIVSGIGTATDTDIVIASTYNGLPVKEIKGGTMDNDFNDSAFGYCDTLTSIVIPDSVTTISDGAFVYCTSLTRITIGNGVTSIGNYAFCRCTSLESITIPDSVISIGNYAFNSCYSLTSVTIGKGVTSIGWYAFQYCTSLESITVNSGNTVYHSSGNCLIETESKTLIAGCKNSVIPSDGSVTSIGYAAFSWYNSLTSITIPDSVTTIGYAAFGECTSLTSITIPDSVTSIDYHAFYRCTSLTSVTFENTEGWSAGSTSISSSDLADPATAAKYLTGTYCWYDWYRS